MPKRARLDTGKVNRPARSSRSFRSASSSRRRRSQTVKLKPDGRRYRGWRVLLNPLWCYWGFIVSVIVVTIFGLLMVFSSSTVSSVSKQESPWSELFSQGVYCLIGVGFAVVAMHLPRSLYQRFGIVTVLIAWVLQALTFTPLGRGAGGNNGWLYLFGVSLQPAEVLKLALCIYLPRSLMLAKSRYRVLPLWKAYALPLGIFVVSFMLVIGGKDLGTAMIIVLIGFFAFLVGEFPLKILGLVSVVGAIGIVCMFVLGSGNRMSRIQATYGTCTDTQGVCWQITHGMYAMGSGGLLGVGLGNSREKWGYLPAAHNDFIFAIIGEELGFVGAGLLILGFVTMGWCLVVVALQARDVYPRMVLVCIAGWIVGQALINICVVLKILPVIGLPMPFVSSGGSALIMCLIAAGVAVQMMKQQPDVAAGLAKA